MEPAYTNIQIPTELATEIDRRVQRRYHGYTSRAEFTKDAIRRMLAESQDSFRSATASKATA